MSLETFLVTLIGSSALAVILTTFKDTWLSWFNNRLRLDVSKRAKVMLGKRLDIYDVMNNVKNRTGSPRVLVTYTEDGGGLPTTGSPLYISILYETVDHESTSIKEDIQRLITDEAYDNMLSHLATKGTYFIITDDLDNGILKKFYRHDNIQSSIMVPISSTKSRFYYMSIAWQERKTLEEMEALELDAIIAANKIKVLLED